MFPNWTGWKTIKLILAIVAAAASGVAGAHITDAVTSLATTLGTIDGIALSLVVVLSGTSAGPAVAGRAVLKLLPFALLGALGVAGVEACTPAQVKSATDASGAICQVIVQATDPALVPLCVTAQQLAEAIEALTVHGAAGVGAPAPSQEALYAYLAAHGAQPVGK